MGLGPNEKTQYEEVEGKYPDEIEPQLTEGELEAIEYYNSPSPR